MRSTGRVAVVALALACILTGCAEGEAPQPSAGVTISPTSTASLEEPEATQLPQTQTIRQRCGFDMDGRTMVIPGPDDQTHLSAVELGEGADVAILVHQTGNTALCGWLPYASWASRQGVRTILVDACWYGESDCSEAVRDSPEAWLGAAVEWAREHGARNVTLVGASMGGAVVTAVGGEVGADAVVNLSGPSRWEDLPPLAGAAEELRRPLLVAGADSDEDIDTGFLRRLARLAPSEAARYYAAPSGHGWGMLTSGWTSSPQDTRPSGLGRLVLRWIAGDRA